MDKASPSEAKEILEDLKEKGPDVISQWRGRGATGIKTPEEFYKDMQAPVESKAADFFKKLEDERGLPDKEKTMHVAEGSKILLIDPKTNNWKWATVNTNAELLEWIDKSKGAAKLIERMREAKINEFLNKKRKTKEDF